MTISLYPEKSREDLELDYVQFCAALRLAATELLTLHGHEATEELIVWKISDLLERSATLAIGSAQVLYLRVLTAGVGKPLVH